MPSEKNSQPKAFNFGHVTVSPDGSVDTREVVGVDKAPVIKPFGRKATSPPFAKWWRSHCFSTTGCNPNGWLKNWPSKRLGQGPQYDPDGDGVEE